MRLFDSPSVSRIYIGVVALGAALAYLLAIPAEDAVILYEYSRNLANQGLITYGTQNFTPVEGATDFLWMLLIALFSKAGVSEYGAALIITVLSAYGLYWTLCSRGVSAILAAVSILCSGYFFSALQGFSTLAFSALYVLCLALAFRADRRAYVAVLCMCLLRPDGVIWGIGAVAVLLLAARREDVRGHLRDMLVFLIFPGLLYFLYRVVYFGEWLPLPFLVKASGTRDFLFFYRYSLANVEWVAVPIAVVMIATGASRELILRAFLLFLLPVIFYGALRLEQNVGNRFLAPMFFGGLYLIGGVGRTRPAVAFVLLSVYLTWSQPYIGTLDTIKALVNSKRENVYNISREISSLNGRMLVTEAGRLAYYSGWRVDDSWGLNTPKFAKRMIETSDLTAGHYDLINAHCDLQMLSAATVVKSPTPRSWDSHCAVVTQYVSNNDYDVFLAPFYRGPTLGQAIRFRLNIPYEVVTDRCERHDIFAVSRSYPDREKLVGILMAHGAVPHDPKHQQYVMDTLCVTDQKVHADVR